MPFEKTESNIIDLERAKAVVDLEDVVGGDWDLVLSDIFRKEEPKRLATKILNTLVKQGPMSQKQLSEKLMVRDLSISSILDKLEEYGFIVREWRGQEKIVRANI